MRKNNIRTIILIVLILIAFSSYSQLNMSQMIDIRLGETFQASKGKIKDMFSKKPNRIMKSDFFGAYSIEYDNTPFDFYGNCDYHFQYAKDTLVATSVKFEFHSSDTIKFARLLTTIVNDLNKDNSKKPFSQYRPLNISSIIQYVHKECLTTTDKNDKNYKPINRKFLGQNAWAIFSNSIYTGKFITLYVELAETHESNVGFGMPSSKYDGGVVSVTLELSSENLQELKNEEEGLNIRNYNLISDNEKINLKFQNGVYLVPVKLNNTLSIDFVLDLGASDVLISPDIFLVLYKAGTIHESDFIGTQIYQFADGTTAKSNVFNIESIVIGDKEIKNVRASISNSINTPLLLGQSALQKLNSYRIDNYKKLLIID